jgi:DNA-binding PadR family transcriptional regulator
MSHRTATRDRRAISTRGFSCKRSASSMPSPPTAAPVHSPRSHDDSTCRQPPSIDTQEPGGLSECSSKTRTPANTGERASTAQRVKMPATRSSPGDRVDAGNVSRDGGVQRRPTAGGHSAGESGWMRGASGPLRGALLGLLLECPGHGGDLAGRLSERLGEMWRVDSDDVYRLLEQLQRDGLASSCEQRRGKSRRRLIYYPTPATSSALSLWMQTQLPREPARVAIHAKLAVARPQDAASLLRALQAYEQECCVLACQSPQASTERGTWGALCADCVRDAVYARLEAEAQWAARTRSRLRIAAAQAYGSFA